MKLAVGEVLVAVAGITGNSMSLTDGDSAVMLTRYDGGEENQRAEKGGGKQL